MQRMVVQLVHVREQRHRPRDVRCRPTAAVATAAAATTGCAGEAARDTLVEVSE
jgi:hypothetical protein